MQRSPSVLVLSLALSACTADATSANVKGSAQANAAATEPPSEAPPCDLDKVAALANALAGADARARRDAVTQGLGDACALPELVSEFLARQPEQPAGPSTETLAAQKTARLVCPGAAVIMAQAAALQGRERAGLIYDRCDFSRFDLLRRASFVERTSGTLVPFYVYEWLGRQGVPAAQAKAIARGLLLVDRLDWNREGLTLPVANYAIAPVPDAAAVHVTQTGIGLGGPTLVELDNGALASATGAGSGEAPPVLAALVEPLTELRASRTEAGVVDRLVLAAHKDTSPSVIFNIIQTASQVGYSEYALLVEEAPMVFGAVVLSQYVGEGAVGAQPAVSVAIDAKGYALRDLGRPMDEVRRIDGPDAADPWDVAALGKFASTIKSRDAKAESAWVGVADGVPYGVVLRSIAALRGERCDVDGTCVLPQIHLTTIARTQRTAAGFLGILGREAGALSGTAGFGAAFGTADEDVWGGLSGLEVAEAFGGSGLAGIGIGSGGSTIGLGSVGTLGKRGGGTAHGFGSGSGLGGGGKRKAARVRPSKAAIKGSLDKDIIRRIVRGNLSEVRYCYSKSLAKDATLAGKVTVRFVIDATGNVSSAKVASSSVSDASVGTCIARAVKRWKFPRPTGGGIVNVSYPFVLSPA